MTTSSARTTCALARRIPCQSRLFACESSAYYADSYEISLAQHGLSATQLYRNVMAGTPAWINLLMRVREQVVPLFGIRKVGLLGSGLKAIGSHENANVTVGQKMDIFTVHSVSEQEIIVGEDDSHLNFRLSLLKLWEGGQWKLVLSMTVTVNNRVGRMYMNTILPFHKLIMKTSLNRAFKKGFI